MPKRICFTVTNDLSLDQRMDRICRSLSASGYQVILVGRKKTDSFPLAPKPYKQKRIRCFCTSGFLFYAEYNTKLFFYLLFLKTDGLCAIDLDTILPCYFVSALRSKTRIYDAHELFSEMKEVVTRPLVHKIWKGIEKITVPHFTYGYTVNEPIREIFRKEYNRNYEVILNVPVYIASVAAVEKDRFILYQGSVNHGRSFETLIPAFQWIDIPLFIVGEGNFLAEAKKLVSDQGLDKKIIFKGKMPPEELRKLTPKALMGVNLIENTGLNNYYSLANRFFDYIHASVPQLSVDYPAYREINKKFEVAELISDLSSDSIARHINALINDQDKLRKMQQNCEAAAKVYNWQEEEKKLLAYYKNIF